MREEKATRKRRMMGAIQKIKGESEVYFVLCSGYWFWFGKLRKQRQEFHVFLLVFTLGLIKDGDAFARVVDYSLTP